MPRRSVRLRALNQRACLVEGRFCFRRPIAFDVHKSVCKGDLEFHLLAAQGRCPRQRPDLVEGPPQLRDPFDQRRARQRLLSGLAPQSRGLLDLPSLSAVTREQFWLVLGNLRELASRVSAIRACSARRGSRSSVP